MSAINGKELAWRPGTQAKAGAFGQRVWNVGQVRPAQGYGRADANSLPLLIDWPFSSDEYGIAYDQANLWGIYLYPDGATNSDPCGIITPNPFAINDNYGRWLAVPKTLNPAYGYVNKNRRQFTGPCQTWYPAYFANTFPRPKQRDANGHIPELRADNYFRPCARGNKAIFGFNEAAGNGLLVGSVNFIPFAPTIGGWQVLGVNVSAGAFAGSYAQGTPITRLRGITVACAVATFSGNATVTVAYDYDPLNPWNMTTGANSPTVIGSFSAANQTGTAATWYSIAVSTPTAKEGVMSNVYLIVPIDTVHNTSAQWQARLSPATDIPLHFSVTTADRHAPGGVVP
jgi:hypothetical protein